MRTKLTLVSFGKDGRKVSKFLRLPLNEKGRPVLPLTEVNKIYNELGVNRGDTISIGI